MDERQLAESMRKYLMRLASVDATTLPVGTHEHECGFYVYLRSGRKFGVSVGLTGRD